MLMLRVHSYWVVPLHHGVIDSLHFEGTGKPATQYKNPEDLGPQSAWFYISDLARYQYSCENLQFFKTH